MLAALCQNSRKIRLFLATTTNLNLKTSSLREVTKCGLAEIYRRFGEACYIHLKRRSFRDGWNICVMHSYGGYGGVCFLVAIADDHSVVGNFN